MIDFEIMERALKIAWIKRIIEGADASWKIILNYAVRQFGGVDFLINCDYDVKTLNLEQLPEFYRTVLCYWQEFKCSTDSNKIPVHDLILQTKKFLKCDWLRPVVFKPNLKYLHVKITASRVLL